MMNQQDKPLIQPCFPSSWVQPLRDRTRDFVGPIPPGGFKHVHVTIDPSGHGFSRAVVVSTVEYADPEKKLVVRRRVPCIFVY